MDFFDDHSIFGPHVLFVVHLAIFIVVGIDASEVHASDVHFGSQGDLALDWIFAIGWFEFGGWLECFDSLGAIVHFLFAVGQTDHKFFIVEVIVVNLEDGEPQDDATGDQGCQNQSV